MTVLRRFSSQQNAAVWLHLSKTGIFQHSLGTAFSDSLSNKQKTSHFRLFSAECVIFSAKSTHQHQFRATRSKTPLLRIQDSSVCLCSGDSSYSSSVCLCSGDSSDSSSVCLCSGGSSDSSSVCLCSADGTERFHGAESRRLRKEVKK